MKSKVRNSLLALILTATLGSPALAATLGSGAPNITSTNYTWLATTYTGAFAIIPADVKSQVDTQAQTTTYTITVKEVPNPWSIRDSLLPTISAAGGNIDDYKDYAYSLADYKVQVQYDYSDPHSPGFSRKTYRVARLNQTDYNAQGQAIGITQTFPEDYQTVSPGSDAYQIAYILERNYYNPDVMPSVKDTAKGSGKTGSMY